MNGNLERAKRKVKHHYKRTWVGYLTPCEIMALIEAGVRYEKSQEWVVSSAEARVKLGLCNPHWFYFEPNGVVVHEEVPQSSRKRKKDS